MRELGHERPQVFSPASDLFWLSALIREIRDRLLHRINTVPVPVCDDASVMAAMFLVRAWSVLDPEVERLLGRVQ